ncbi:haloacid dehalogenase type II [Catenuloplanes japonicus]|uniref:haloacid dehalogenase type II n=1 Tax=Catenuloplanes japonicus TaxID=33876 RepID=UPI00069112FC|nr:haloacid dehalogenase type II [Catenuloplanes japonicus]
MLWVFDVNETLLDLAPLDDVFARHTGAAELRATWFDLVIRTALTTTAAGEYRDFGQIGGACARAVADAHGTPLDDAALGEVAGTMRGLPAHPEVAATLTALRADGHRIVALANSPQATVDAQLAHAGLAPLFDAVYSAETVRALKPSPAAYRLVLDTEQTDPARTAMVAAHDWDIAGAHAAGMRTAFVARAGRRPLPHWPAPDAVGADLAEATSALLTSSASHETPSLASLGERRTGVA